MQFKNKYFVLNYFNKTDQLNIENKLLKRIVFGGQIMTVNWRNEFTKFDINDYVKVSKKQRSHELEKKEKKILNYSYTGICISSKRNLIGTNSRFVIRNVFDSFHLR